MAAPEPARAQMQEWGRFPAFLTTELWQSLMGADKQLRKIELCAQHLVALGLRHPSEKTFAVLSALIAITGNEQMDDDVLRQTALLSTCKSVVRTKIIKAKQLLTALPGGYLLELPATLDGLPQPLRDQFFANGLPEAPLDLNRVWRSGNAWPMRSSHRARQASGNWSLQQQGFQMNVIAQQAAMTTAQAMLAMSGQGAHQTLPGLQIFNVAGRPAASTMTNPEEPRAVALEKLLQRAEEPKGSAAPLALTDGSVATSVVPQVAAAQAAAVPEHTASQSQPAEDIVVAAEPADTLITKAPSSVLEATAAQRSPANEASAVEDDLLQFAEMHYERSLPAVVQAEADSAQQTAAPDRAGTKKPAAAKAKCRMKKPSAAVAKSVAKMKSGLKKPAATSSGMKRPAAAEKSKKLWKEITRAKAMKLKPEGCSKCRYQCGCCPSCWADREVLLLG